MKFIACDPTTAIAELYDTLSGSLAKHSNVLWLVSGGSNITPSKYVLDQLSPEQREHLTIALVDERFGPVGHTESNYQKLVSAGFSPDPATFVPVLHEGLDLEQTTTRYRDSLQQLLAKADRVICQLGIASDTHTAGILPNAPIADSSHIVDSYQGPEYQRITITFSGLKKMEKIVVFAFGSDKLGALTSLRDTTASPGEQPSQILKQIPDVTIYNDSLQGEV